MGASVVELSIDRSTTAGGRMTDITEENIQATRDYALPTFNLRKQQEEKKLSHLEITHSYGNVVSKNLRMVVEGQSCHHVQIKLKY